MTNQFKTFHLNQSADFEGHNCSEKQRLSPELGLCHKTDNGWIVLFRFRSLSEDSWINRQELPLLRLLPQRVCVSHALLLLKSPQLALFTKVIQSYNIALHGAYLCYNVSSKNYFHSERNTKRSSAPAHMAWSPVCRAPFKSTTFHDLQPNITWSVIIYAV